MPTLIIGDLHHQTHHADRILATEPHERAVFLGDYFDAGDDGPGHARRTAEWVRARLEEPENTLLFGNHDLPYAFPRNPYVGCSGVTHAKSLAISEVLDRADWDAFQLCAWVGPWLVSHAGLSRGLLLAEMLLTPATLEERCREALGRLRYGRFDPLIAAGRERGGDASVGGLTWCDWGAFEGVAGVHQICGHSLSRDEPLRENTETRHSINLCLDYLFGRTYAVVGADETLIKCLDTQGRGVALARYDHSELTRATQAERARRTPPPLPVHEPSHGYDLRLGPRRSSGLWAATLARGTTLQVARTARPAGWRG